MPLSGLAHADIIDPVDAIVLGDRPPLLGAARAVPIPDRLLTADEEEHTADRLGAHRKLVSA